MKPTTGGPVVAPRLDLEYNVRSVSPLMEHLLRLAASRYLIILSPRAAFVAEAGYLVTPFHRTVFQTLAPSVALGGPRD
jgi:hypothetical protein